MLIYYKQSQYIIMYHYFNIIYISFIFTLCINIIYIPILTFRQALPFVRSWRADHFNIGNKRKLYSKHKFTKININIYILF